MFKPVWWCITPLWLMACSPYEVYHQALVTGVKPVSCQAGSPLPYQQRLVRGQAVVALCGQDSTDAEQLLQQAHLVVGEPAEFWAGEGHPDEASGQIIVRYPLHETGKGTVPGSRVPFDALIVWDEHFRQRMLGLVLAQASLPGKKAGEVLSGLEESQRLDAGDSQHFRADFYSRLQGPVLYYDLQKKLQSLAGREVDAFNRASVASVKWSHEDFTSAVCQSARFLFRSRHEDPLNDGVADRVPMLVNRLFRSPDEPEAVKLLTALRNPETRCAPAIMVNAVADAQVVQARMEEERRQVEARQRQVAESARRQAEEQRLAVLEQLRAQAESMAFDQRFFSALAVLQGLAFATGQNPDAYGLPEHPVALSRGLDAGALLAAVRGAIARQYWLRVEYGDGVRQEARMWPQVLPMESAPARVVRAAMVLQQKPVVTGTTTEQRSWSTEGGEFVDQDALARRQAQQADERKGLLKEAGPDARRLQELDRRLAWIDNRLQAPRMEVRASGSKREVSRVQEVCEPVPGGPAKCVNRWTTFSADGPMRSNGGLTTSEASDLETERNRLVQERRELVSRLSALDRRATALQGVAEEPVRRMKTLHFEEVQLYTYQAEGNMQVRVSLEGKPWFDFDVPLTNRHIEKSRPTEYLEFFENNFKVYAFNESESDLEIRMRSALLQALEQKAADSEEWRQEYNLANVYLDAKNSRDFLNSSISVLRRLGVTLPCGTQGQGCPNVD